MLTQHVLLTLSIATSVLGIGTLLVRSGRQFGELRGDVNGLRREMTLQFAGVDERFRAAEVQTSLRFDAVDARFVSRFDGVDACFDGLDARFDRVDARLDRVEDRLIGVEGRLGAVEVTVARIDQRLEDHLRDPEAHQAASR